MPVIKLKVSELSVIDIEELKALEREAYASYRSDVRCCVNSHDSFFEWQGLKDKLSNLGVQTEELVKCQ